MIEFENFNQFWFINLTRLFGNTFLTLNCAFGFKLQISANGYVVLNVRLKKLHGKIFFSSFNIFDKLMLNDRD